MPYLWLLAFAVFQLLLLATWPLQGTSQSYSLLWWLNFCGIGGCCLLIGWLVPRIYRVWLWRRRKSVRPSREIQLERRRIAAALHDGLGSQLVNAIALADGSHDPHIRSTLEQCLLDLRMVVDSMDAGDDALPILLARFRHRIQPVFERRNIALHWDIWDPEMLGEEGSLPRGALAREILAILQEAISNVLQHAEATEVSITLTSSHPANFVGAQRAFAHACLRIEDDGKGLRDVVPNSTAMPDRTGMGLANMRRRAAAAGCQLEISVRDGGGTVVELCW